MSPSTLGGGRGVFAAPRRHARPILAAALAAALALLLAACGSGAQADRAAPPAASFPDPAGRGLSDLYAESEAQSNLVVLPAGIVYDEGDRLGFSVYTPGKEKVTDADVALYFEHGEDGRALGPYPARIESLETKPAFVSQTTGTDPEASKALYVVEHPPFRAKGEWRVMAAIDEGGTLATTFLPSRIVGHYPSARPGFPRSPANPPDVGEHAPVVHTPTADDVADLREIDTRVPPDNMHADDLAEVLSRKPVVLVFSTPGFCQSRVCGPVVDVTEQARQAFKDRVSFIHMEIYAENEPRQGVRPQVKAYRLPSEPWLFAIDEDGVIRERLEGAWSVADAEAAARKALSGATGKAEDERANDER